MMRGRAKNELRVIGLIAGSQMYREYAQAFTQGTGLPLRLCGPEMFEVIRHAKAQENPFCALVAKTNKGCAHCYLQQRTLEQKAGLKPETLRCFAGLCETMVPVRVGENVFAFLQTGQVLLQQPNKARFNRIAATLLKWGSEVDLKCMEEAYFNSRVLPWTQYKALVGLLKIFADHLAACSEALALLESRSESPAIKQARGFIADHAEGRISLAAVAKVVNMSASYFSEKFKQTTGINFVEYVARVRVVKAQSLLLNPNLRVSEIAYEVGFRSLSQFNRAFKREVGDSPSRWRIRKNAQLFRSHA